MTAINNNEKLFTYLKDYTDITIKDSMTPTHNTLPAHVVVFKITEHKDTIKERFPTQKLFRKLVEKPTLSRKETTPPDKGKSCLFAFLNLFRQGCAQNW